MGSLSGVLHRPLSAAAALAVAAVSSDLSDKFTSPKPDSLQAPSKASDSWVSRVSFSNISVGSKVWKLADENTHPSSNPSGFLRPDPLCSSFSSPFASPPVLALYSYLKLARSPQLADITPPDPVSSDEVMYRWHLPKTNNSESLGNLECSAIKSQTVVVLLGWLGAKQKHLKRYADWYTSRGFHVVTFTIPLADILSYNCGRTAEQNIDLLANHLADLVAEEQGKNLIFHTFSNTGWIMYGVILENFQKQDPSLMGKIKGCIVDSAPVPNPDPQVWASGFSAAFLKKNSVATKGMLQMNDSSVGAVFNNATVEPKPAAAETALLTILEMFFEVVLSLPPVNRRLTGVFDLLSSKQPKCPQLYVYSSSDRVIPAQSVESFIEGQRKAGHEVRAYDFVSSPHVDHFRNHPSIYASQITAFLDDYVLTGCKASSLDKTEGRKKERE
uniref:Transmembrane protein 53 n=1 Tax=Anthurium amnicola TaxID=1678845 RepID=A0A1D1XWY2_9ARAE